MILLMLLLHPGHRDQSVHGRKVRADLGAVKRSVGGSAQRGTGSEKQAALLAAALPLHNRVKMNASGRPGPNVITSTYRRSIHLEPAKSGDSVVIGTNAPQGARLEFGFSGTDSLGRVYDQPAYPHFRPAMATERGRMIKEFAKAMQHLLKKRGAS